MLQVAEVSGRGSRAETGTVVIYNRGPLLPELIALALGLALLLAGAHLFVNNASAIAATLGVPPLVIGMTMVAFGTSAPELVINSVSAARGSTGLSFGNVVGSCVVNVGFVLAVTAILQPLKVQPSLITREIPMMLVAVAAVVVLGADQLIDGVGTARWSRVDGLVLLLFFGIFLYYTAREAITSRHSDAFMAEVSEQESAEETRPVWRLVLLAVIGLAALSAGADLTVENAVGIARTLAVSEAVIGLTIVSIGTTLPELATCIMAARRGDPDIALGNVVGSNIFNLLCVGGIVSTIRPVPIPEGGAADLAVLGLLAAVLLPIAIRSQRTVTRGEGVFLLAIYIAYLTSRLALSLS